MRSHEKMREGKSIGRWYRRYLGISRRDDVEMIGRAIRHQ